MPVGVLDPSSVTRAMMAEVLTHSFITTLGKLNLASKNTLFGLIISELTIRKFVERHTVNPWDSYDSRLW